MTGDETWNDVPAEMSLTDSTAASSRATSTLQDTFEGKTINLMSNLALNNIEWTPIGDFGGSDGNQFRGNFNGQNNIIEEMRLKSNSLGGLFGNVLLGSISNISVCNSNINGEQVAAIAGTIDSSTIINCHSIGNTITGTKCAGGVVIDLCYGAKVINSSNSSKVICTTTSNLMYSGAGGIVAWGIDGFKYDTKEYAQILNCFNVGNIESSGGDIGGIVGCIWGAEIENCYNAGLIKYKGSSNIGGLCGYFQNNIMRNCYNVGELVNVEGLEVKGELIGLGSDRLVENCYYIKDRYGSIGVKLEPGHPDYIEGDDYTDIVNNVCSKMRQDDKAIC